MKFAEIRIPSKTDFGELTEVWEASVRATHTFLSEHDIQYFKPLILNEYLGSVRLFCIYKLDRIAGFIGLSEDKIEMLFVDPAYFGQGIGKLLMNFAIQEFGIKKVDVNEHNMQAVGFYKKLGFHVVSRSETDGSGKPFPILSMELPC